MSRGAQAIAIDVAIVNWNTSEAALAAAAAFAASDGVEARVTVIDNASGVEQRRLLVEGAATGFEIEAAATNLGYGTAANRVLAGGEAELVCVSNADVVPDPGALAALAAAAQAEPRAGMVGPVFGGGTDRYHAELPGGLTLLGRIFAGSFRAAPVPLPAAGETVEVGQPSGACFLMRRGAWERVGGFDEGFFLWYEDVDLARRLHDASLRNLVTGSARVSHGGARSFAQVDPARQQQIRLDSVERYIGKHHRGVASLARPLLWTSRRLRAR